MGQLSDSLKNQEKLVLGDLSGYMTTEGRPAYNNNFGGMSTEYSIGVKNKQINNGQLTHIPSIYNGRIVSEEQAIQNIIDANGYDPETGRLITPGGDPEARSQGLELIKLIARKPEKAYRQSRLSDKLTQGTTDPKEDDFQRGIRGTSWFSDFVKQYGEEPDLRPVSEDPALGPNYDYRKAWAAGVRPEPDPYDNNRQHWPSSSPDGKMLKSKNHPTAWKEPFMRQYGVNPDSLPSSVSEWLVEGMPSR